MSEMQKFYGTKLIQAAAMTRLEYCQYRGWHVPPDENGADEGYLVEYEPDGKPNHPDHKGYISWSPKSVFRAAYQPLDRLSFGHALEALESGERVRRAGWDGKGMWLMLIAGDAQNVSNIDYVVRGLSDRTEKYLGGLETLSWIGMKTADDKFVPWLASQTDMLAKDWQIVE